MRLESSSTAITVLSGGRLFAGNRVGVSHETHTAPAPALLAAFPGQAVEERRAVRLVPRKEVPAGVLAIGSELAQELDLEAVRSPWTLTTDGFEHLPARELLLELTIEQPLESAVLALNRSEEIYGALLWLEPGDDVSALSLEVGGITCRVRSVSPAPSGRGSIIEINERTRLELFAPGVKSGVDIVVLADCSGSMDIADLTETAEQVGAAGFISRLAGVRSAGLKRSEALRRALKTLLDLRLGLAGRVSRIALVAFTENCVVRFPRGGGMQEMDESASSVVVQEFRDALSLLQAESAGTDIGQALQFAAELLYRHGHPANDRLIVLISDGAHWAKRGDEATGEEMLASKEPISLMTHLHRDMKIQLHAIGISTDALFRRYWDAQPGRRGTVPHVSSVPNHTLLEELVRVGGGDPSRTGDAHVLEDYFSGLGTGVTRAVQSPKARDLPEPSAEELRGLAAITRTGPTGPALEECFRLTEKLSGEIFELYISCNDYGQAVDQHPVFRTTNKSLKTLKTLADKKVRTQDEFQNFILRTYQMFYEARAKRRAKKPDEIRPGDIRIDETLRDPRLADLHALRITFAHDTELPDPNPRWDNTDKNRRASDALRRMVGVAHIEPDNALGWAALQAAILKDVREVLTNIRSAYQEAAQSVPAGSDTGGGFVWRE